MNTEAGGETAAPNPPASIDRRSAYSWFDLLRLVAALVVVIEHARDLLWLDYAQAGSVGLVWRAIYFVTGLGHEAVMIFFVLSGYWITATIDRRPKAAGFWAEYLIDRLSRLMIVIVPALVLGVAYDLAGIKLLAGELYSGMSGAATIRVPVETRLAPEIFLGNLVFLQTLVVPPLGSNGPLWSLANEFWYYLWFPAIVVSWARRKPAALLFALAAGVIWPVLLPGFAVWLLGAGLYHLDKCGWPGFPSARSLRLVILATGALALGSSLVMARAQVLPPLASDWAVGGSFALFAAGLLLLDPPLPRWLVPGASYGARASFSLYVSHFPLLVLLATLVTPSHRLAPGTGALVLLLGLIAAALVHGRLFAALSESRTGHLRSWLRTRLLRPAAVQPV